MYLFKFIPPTKQHSCHRKTMGLYLCLCMVLCTVVVDATIFGSDDRRSYYQFTDVEKSWSDATMMVSFRQWMGRDALTATPTGKWTGPWEPYNGGTAAMSNYPAVNDRPFCPNEKYADAQTFFGGYCTANLISPTLALTAGHCVPSWDPNVDQLCSTTMRFIFGVRKTSADSDVSSEFAVQDVYSCKRIVDTKNEQLSVGLDYAIIELDRPVDAKWNKPRPVSNTKPTVGDSVAILCHPSSLDVKISTGQVMSVGAFNFQVNADAAAGCSGSMVIDTQTGMIIGSVQAVQQDFEVTPTCIRSNVCSDSQGCSNGGFTTVLFPSTWTSAVNGQLPFNPPSTPPTTDGTANPAPVDAIPVAPVDGSKIPVEVFVLDQEITYGQIPSLATYRVSYLIPSMPTFNAVLANVFSAAFRDVATGKLAFASEGNRYSKPGKYALTVSGLASDKYEYMYRPGFLHIRPAVLTVRSLPIYRKFGQAFITEADYRHSIVGFQNGEDESKLNGKLHSFCIVQQVPTSPIGMYPIFIDGYNSEYYDIVWVRGHVFITADGQPPTDGNTSPTAVPFQAPDVPAVTDDNLYPTSPLSDDGIGADKTCRMPFKIECHDCALQQLNGGRVKWTLGTVQKAILKTQQALPFGSGIELIYDHYYAGEDFTVLSGGVSWQDPNAWGMGLNVPKGAYVEFAGNGGFHYVVQGMGLKDDYQSNLDVTRWRFPPRIGKRSWGRMQLGVSGTKVQLIAETKDNQYEAQQYELTQAERESLKEMWMQLSFTSPGGIGLPGSSHIQLMGGYIVNIQGDRQLFHFRIDDAATPKRLCAVPAPAGSRDPYDVIVGTPVTVPDPAEPEEVANSEPATTVRLLMKDSFRDIAEGVYGTQLIQDLTNALFVDDVRFKIQRFYADDARDATFVEFLVLPHDGRSSNVSPRSVDDVYSSLQNMVVRRDSRLLSGIVTRNVHVDDDRVISRTAACRSAGASSSWVACPRGDGNDDGGGGSSSAGIIILIVFLLILFGVCIWFGGPKALVWWKGRQRTHGRYVAAGDGGDVEDGRLGSFSRSSQYESEEDDDDDDDEDDSSLASDDPDDDDSDM